jgi:predicted AlkP superfamily phosphohydrolase/phosphomutase
MASRILVVGLDGLSPELVEQWRGELPTLDHLMRGGVYGRLHSMIPALTPPAWTAVLTGVNPGRFGFWDFTVRAGHSYADFRLVRSTDVRAPGFDQRLAAAGRRVIRVSVPVAYPPPELPGGAAVSCFLAPSPRHRITSPPTLQRELEAVAGPYLLDATGANGTAEERRALLEAVAGMDKQRFDVTAHLMRTRQWDVAFVVVMGTDRIAHYFFKDLDPAHPDHVPQSPWHDAMFDRYVDCDRRLASLIDDAGDAVVLVLSDHGTQRIGGKLFLNEWLAARGYLTLAEAPGQPVGPRDARIDWSRTRAWAYGAGGGIHLNMSGRESEGIVAPERYDDVVAELTRDLMTLATPAGRRLRVDVVERRYLYDGPWAANAPDLFVIVEDLRWLVSDQIGAGRECMERGFGRDGACHAPVGFFALAGPGVAAGGFYPHATLYDIAPTVLALAGLDVPADLEGHSLIPPSDPAAAADDDDTMSRLRSLYLS